MTTPALLSDKLMDFPGEVFGAAVQKNQVHDDTYTCQHYTCLLCMCSTYLFELNCYSTQYLYVTTGLIVLFSRLETACCVLFCCVLSFVSARLFFLF